MAHHRVSDRMQNRASTALPLFDKLRNRLLFVMMVACVLICGCSTSTKDAKVIVKEGKATSQTLADYYDTLAADEKNRFESANHLELALANEGYLPDDPEFAAHYHSATRPVAQVIANYKKSLDDEKVTLEALKARAETTRKLNDLYVSLGNLVDYDASGEVSKSAGSLSDAIQKLNHHKLTLILPIDLGEQASATNLLDGAVKALAKQQQLREVRKNAPLIRQVLEGLTHLYHAELPVYKVMRRDHYSFATALALAQIKSGDAFLVSRKKPYLALFDLDMLIKPSSDPVIRAAEEVAARKEIEQKSAAYIEGSRKDSDDLLTALCILKVDHDRFEKRKPLTKSATDVDVQAYLTNLNQAH